MNNRNKTTRIVLRWAHLLVGFLIGVFVYTPAHDNGTFVLLMQVAVLPAVTLTGVWMWQQARIKGLYRHSFQRPQPSGARPTRSRAGEGPKEVSGTLGRLKARR